MVVVSWWGERRKREIAVLEIQSQGCCIVDLRRQPDFRAAAGHQAGTAYKSLSPLQQVRRTDIFQQLGALTNAKSLSGMAAIHSSF